MWKKRKTVNQKLSQRKRTKSMTWIVQTKKKSRGIKRNLTKRKKRRERGRKRN